MKRIFFSPWQRLLLLSPHFFQRKARKTPCMRLTEILTRSSAFLSRPSPTRRLPQRSAPNGRARPATALPSSSRTAAWSHATDRATSSKSAAALFLPTATRPHCFSRWTTSIPPATLAPSASPPTKSAT